MDREVLIMVAMWMFAGLFSILVITNAAAQSCPRNQIASDAQILLYGDTVNVVPENVLGAGLVCGQNLRGPFLRATLPMTVGSCARAMADNGETKGLITPPPR